MCSVGIATTTSTTIECHTWRGREGGGGREEQRDKGGRGREGGREGGREEGRGEKE